ncbi:CBS domain-containing protein [filamentous cyanobacterium LEGE 11480]|uniref:CBS domain-containing protein n=1 Tax=Romeriopsis navalis LEGE 11480 TaxID=2777977 RepID=A0A928VN89_9CYAN|nr:CBS domain-containing protein [Romeriopsis navalis]MBE9030732.1 CBS domain-containing protein [Romeriopsis navalis LEGE 11480]
MSLDPSSAYAPSLEDAIDRDPLIVAPDFSVIETIALISQSHGRTCGLVADVEPAAAVPRSRSSCVLVMSGDALLGILTERDVVRLAADAVDLNDVSIASVMIHPIVTLPQSALQDIFAALFLFRRYRIRHLPVVDDDGKLVGVISHESIRQILRPANLLRFRRVSDVMTDSVIHAPLHTPVLQLAKLMATNRVSCIVITQLNDAQNDYPVGIVTERDIVQFQAFQINLATTQAEAVMSTPLFLLNPEDSLWVAHQEMQQRRVGRLVVSWNWGQGLGLVTQSSLLRVFDPMEMYGVIENLQETIQELQTKLPDSAVTSSSLDLAQVAYGRFEQAKQSAIAADAAADADPANVPALLDQLQQAITQGMQPHISPEQQVAQLQTALDYLSGVRRLLQS